MRPRLTYISGATALLEWQGLRLLTDPAFDPAGSVHDNLVKTQDPAIAVDDVGPVDAVLLSHDHHADNLDALGREFLPHARVVVTTSAGAARLGANAVGLEPWATLELGNGVTVTATPARHGPAENDRGPVIGFVLTHADDPTTLYLTGDTVWYEGVEEVLERFRVTVALLNLGAAKVAAVGDYPLTLTGADGVEVARALPEATLVALHFEGWKHFSDSRADIEAAFSAAGLDDRLVWPPPGDPIEL
jgi:L-ascorbate metabolism protein UlaG (beta-lactamase superfamily)